MEQQQTPGTGKVFQRDVRIQFLDCDPSGIVFFPQYFRMLNNVVEEWWEHLGYPWSELIMTRRIGTPTAHLESSFLLPSRMGETLRFSLSIQHVGNSSLVLEHRAHREERPCLHIVQRLVATALDNHQSRPWPEDVRRALLNFKEHP